MLTSRNYALVYYKYKNCKIFSCNNGLKSSKYDEARCKCVSLVNLVNKSS